MKNRIIEIMIGDPQSIIQRENEPITDLIENVELIEELESRIKELEEEKTTELIIEKEDYYGCLTNITKTKCCGIAPITNENFCPNCGRKIIRK